MGSSFDNYFLKLSCPGFDGDRIAHRSRRNIESGLFPHFVGRQGFQFLDRRIVAKDVIPDFGFGHCPTHFLRGLSYGIAPKIRGLYHCGSFSFLEKRHEQAEAPLKIRPTFSSSRILPDKSSNLQAMPL
jgi:hypothetical protein